MTSDARANPTSLSQQRLWFIEQLVPGTALHNLRAQFVVRGELDIPALERAVNDVIDRHEGLRTCFGILDGAPVQDVLDEARVAVQTLDASDDASVFAKVEEFAREPFSLTQAPLMRVGLVHGNGGTKVLVFVLHHLVADTESLGIFLREVAELCRQEKLGGVPALPELPTRYVDYAIWQRERASTPQAIERCAAQVSELAGFPTVLDLPADRPRPAVQTLAGASLSWHVPPPLVRGLERVAREHGATLEMTLLASFSVVLGLWSGQSRILVATPAATRSPVETERLIGSFANTLVIPADMTGDPSFAAYLERIRDVCLGAVSRQDVPFEELVDGMAPERSLSHNLLVQVMMAFQNGPDLQLKLPDAELELIDTQTETSQFDLVLNVTPRDEGLDCRLHYSTDLFERVTAERFSRHLRRLWEVVAANPDVRVEGIDLADAQERAVLVELGTGPTRPVDPRALPARLFETARRRPDAEATTASDGVYTYAQLVERAEAIGAELVARGLRPGDLAGVALPRGRDLPAGLLGVWVAGGAYVPLDPAYPRARLEHMTRDAGIKVLLTTLDLADRIPVPKGTEVLLLDEPMSALPAEQPLPVADGDSVAYVIYTSGSTGRPKGVLVTHASLGNLLDDFASETGFSASDRLLALTSLSFDIAGLELWLPLLTGGTLVIGPPGVGGDPERLHKLLYDEEITVVQATPPTWKLYTSSIRAAPPALRQIWCGGEHLPHSLAQGLTALGPDVHNLYGPTETTIWSTRAVLRRLDTVTGIGRPISNTSLFVTDAAGRQVPMGVPGELCIGGAGLALGYLGRPDLTAQQFTDVQGVPVYRTGDLVRWRSDGNLEYLGRLDDQVKIRGHRVEPGEVDAVAQACSGVRDACTLAVTTSAGEDQLVTFVTPESVPEQASDPTDDWRTLWENTYAEGEAAAEDDLNLKGWLSSYTKQPLPETDMRDWVARTVERITETGARTFAEIGCGTGLLLLRLAPAADRYLGVDFSAKAIGHVEEAVVRRGIADRVRLATATATEISEVAAGELFDCVVVNSVAQYFPSRDYLTAVLVEASKIVIPGGHIFVGDLRNLRLTEAFHAGVLQTDERMRPGEVRTLAARHALEEDELFIDPGYFAELQDALPTVTGIQVSLKASGFDNEMTRFRYDVLLKIGGEAPDQPQPYEEIGWEEVADLAGLERLLGTSGAAAFVVDGIPNARVARFAQLVENERVPIPSRSLEELDEVAARGGWQTHHAWSSRHPEQGRVRTTLTRRSQVDGPQARFIHDRPAIDGPVSNDPRQGALLRVLKHSTRAFLRQNLPEYMVPNRVLTLPALPLTPNGKTDRNALKSIARQQTSSTDNVPPSGPVQDLLHEMWCEVLGVSRVSVMENIFDAGTTSLLVVRIRQELRDRHAIDIPLTAFFAYPTISSLADVLKPEGERHSSDDRDASPRTQNATAARRRNHRGTKRGGDEIRSGSARTPTTHITGQGSQDGRLND
ncbi:MAG: amino acid adenylation domain-containing protein [Actinomycetota bacterium]